MTFKEKLEAASPGSGEIALFWLGQAGFIIKNSLGKTAVIDPYLSDAVERICGLKRLMMPVIEGCELSVDHILITHRDEDHLDMDVIPEIMERCTSAKLYAPGRAYEMCEEASIDPARLVRFDKGASAEADGFRFEAVYADHGDHAPEAIGYLVETEGYRLYFTGDTSYQVDRMAYAYSKEIDILIVPINGEYGNMNSLEAAELAKVCQPKLVIPSHFWTFIRHGSEPYLFDREMRLEAPEVPFDFMCQGEMLLWNGAVAGRR